MSRLPRVCVSWCTRWATPEDPASTRRTNGVQCLLRTFAMPGRPRLLPSCLRSDRQHLAAVSLFAEVGQAAHQGTDRLRSEMVAVPFGVQRDAENAARSFDEQPMQSEPDIVADDSDCRAYRSNRLRHLWRLALKLQVVGNAGISQRLVEQPASAMVPSQDGKRFFHQFPDCDDLVIVPAVPLGDIRKDG